MKLALILAATVSSVRNALYGNFAGKVTSASAWKKNPDSESMKTGRIRAVLFDFDGTLTLPGALDFSSIRKELSCPHNMPVLEFIEGQPIERRQALLEILTLRETLAAKESRPNVGAERCLLELKRRNIVLGIHTRNSLPSVHLALGKFGSVWPGDFIAIMTRDDCLPKPHPDGVIKASAKMGIPIAELMVVGDFRFDIIAGRSAGACTVLLTNGQKPVYIPGDPEPDHVVDHLEEILELV